MQKHVPTYGLYGEASAQRPRFWMHSETIASRSRFHRWEIRKHRHADFFQILYIRGGLGEALLDDRRHALGPGMLVIVPQGCVHGFHFSKDMDGQVITFVAARLAALASFSQALADPRVVAIDTGSADGRLVGDVLARFGGAVARDGSPALAESLLTSALLLIGGLLATGVTAESPGNERIERLRRLVALHMREHRAVSFYASALGVSATHLNRLTVQATGRNMTGLLADALVDEARRLLVFSGLNIRDVAANLGFADPAYFSRFFATRAGMSPKAFRLAERDTLTGRADPLSIDASAATE